MSFRTLALVAVALSVLPCSAASAQARRFVDLSLNPDHALWVRGHEGDTVLADPNRIAVAGDLLILTDPTGPSVTAISTADGRSRWQYSRRGNGPGELQQPSFATAFGTTVLVADNSTRRLYRFSLAGTFLDEVQVPQGRFVAGLCTPDAGETRLFMHYAAMAGSRLAELSWHSGRLRELPVIFPAVPNDPNAGGFDLSTAPGGGCHAARKVAPGHALLSASGQVLRRGEFVERIRQRPHTPMAAVRDTSQLPIPFSLTNAATRNAIYVYFGGTTSCRFRCIDVYDRTTLAYRHTIRFTGRLGIELRHLAVDDTRLYLLGARDDIPIVAAFRLPSRPRS